MPQNAVADERSRDTDGKSFVVDIAAQRINVEQGFDNDHRSTIADARWRTTVHRYYNRAPYGSATRAVNEGEATDIQESCPDRRHRKRPPLVGVPDTQHPVHRVAASLTEETMMNHRKRQTRDVNHDDANDEQPGDAPNSSDSPVQDSAAPVLQSEDDDSLVDEDAPG